MKASVKKMIKKVLIEGLRQSHYNLNKTIIHYPSGGIFANPKDIQSAFRQASIMLDIWQTKEQGGNSIIPEKFDDFERYLDIYLAESSFDDAYLMINRRFSDRSNAELVKEMKEAIEDLRRLGCHNKVATYEFMMKQRIGEE